MIRILRPVLIAALGALGVTIARHNLTDGPLIVGVAAALAVSCAFFGERGAALGALGIGAAGAFAAPDGIGPLLVLTGVVVACDAAAVDRRLATWRDVIDAAIALPALAGLAGTVAAQPSARAMALGAASAVVVGVAVWRRRPATRAAGLLVMPGLGCLGAFVVALAPDQLSALGDLPTATVQGARSLAAGFAVFVLALLVGVVQAERAGNTKAAPVTNA
ncbi:MAG TPA: hypothetical protein VMZ22_13100 [Acidimicrobiales bacterium]|nr:hypothetical protein [Acidimicrobiales bacterium]